jgi:transposase InsO family protein
MKNQEKSEQIATNRMQLISPLLAEGLDAAKTMQLRKQLCEQTGVSDRTLRRYQSQYSQNGFSGLKPRDRQHQTPEAIPANVLDQAILLRREVPTRSVAQIIQILEWEGLIEPKQIKRSTLQERFMHKGYSTRHMKLYNTSGVATRRFQRRQRNTLWHSDIKFGPFLPIGPGGEKKQVYMVAVLDDATRFVLHGEFYPSLDSTTVEDCLRKSIMKYGLPEAVYFDNGKQFRNKWMTRACAKMGVRLLYAQPYSPESTGKIEKYNKLIENFLNEVYLAKPQTLDHLNELYRVWMEECYQNKPHSVLKNNQTPAYMYKTDARPLKFIDVDTLANAFLHCESRKVDKAGCISFESKKYEVGVQFTGFSVDVVFDPSDTRIVTIEHENCKSFTAKEIQIGERTAPKPVLPERFMQKTAESSRLLNAAVIKNKERKLQNVNAISYRTQGKEAGVNV